MSLADFYAILRDFKSQSLVVFLHDNCVFFKDNKDNRNNGKNRRNCGCHEVTYNKDNNITTNGIVVSVVSVVVKIIKSIRENKSVVVKKSGAWDGNFSENKTFSCTDRKKCIYLQSPEN